MKKALLCLAVLFYFCPGAWVWAADFPRVAGQINTELAEAKKEQAQTLKEIAQRRADLQQRILQAEAGLKSEKQRLAAAQQSLKTTHQQRLELINKLEQESGDLKELAGNVRAAARDLLALAERSPVTAQNPGRLPGLRSYLDKTRYPGIAEIERLIQEYLYEIRATAQIASEQGTILDEQGRENQADLVRIGGMNTIFRQGDRVGFASIAPTSGRLLTVSGELPWGQEGALQDFLTGRSSEVFLDITGGAALKQLSRRSDLWQHLQSGGPLIWPILFVGLLAAALIGERLFHLQRMRAKTDGLMDRVNQLVAQGDFKAAHAQAESQAGQPASNVIKAGLSLQGCSAEALETRLGEAMLKELPRLERFLTALKMLAAVAPLLGLLGTVTGMINTFQVITVFGTGDPRLMAGGISEALVTTEVGLAVAIPVMVASALLRRKAQRISGDMEEKALALSAAMLAQAGK
jgi:biopolymer transport protein ExbB